MSRTGKIEVAVDYSHGKDKTMVVWATCVGDVVQVLAIEELAK